MYILLFGFEFDYVQIKFTTIGLKWLMTFMDNG